MRIQSGNMQGAKVGLKDNDFMLEAISKQMLRLQEKIKRVEADNKLSPEEKAKQKKLVNDQLNTLRRQYAQKEMAVAVEQKKAKPVSGDRSDEIKQDAVRGVDVTKKEQKVSSLSASIQRMLENMTAEEPRAFESSDEKALKSIPNEMKNRGGHVDMMI